MAKLAEMKSKRPLRFVAVGVTNTVIDFGILNILLPFGIPKLVANTVSMTCALIFSFFANKKYTFRSKDTNQLRREMILFLAFTLFGLYIIQNGCLWLITHYFHPYGINEQLFTNIAKVIASVPSLIWNYTTYARFVFRDKEAKNG